MKLKRDANIDRLIKKYGSGYRAAKALKMAPQSFYERMHKAGVQPKGNYHRLSREPESTKAKIAWMRKLIKRSSIKKIAENLNVSESLIRERLKKYGISFQPPKAERVKDLKKLLKKYKTGYRVAKVLKVTPSTVYEKVHAYGLSL